MLLSNGGDDWQEISQLNSCTTAIEPGSIDVAVRRVRRTRATNSEREQVRSPTNLTEYPSLQIDP